MWIPRRRVPTSLNTWDFPPPVRVTRSIFLAEFSGRKRWQRASICMGRGVRDQTCSEAREIASAVEFAGRGGGSATRSGRPASSGPTSVPARPAVSRGGPSAAAAIARSSGRSAGGTAGIRSGRRKSETSHPEPRGAAAGEESADEGRARHWTNSSLSDSTTSPQAKMRTRVSTTSAGAAGRRWATN